MELSDNDLLQLSEKELLELPEDVVRRLPIKLLTDLKAARERLKQTSQNSSRLPSSDLPWNKVTDDDDEAECVCDTCGHLHAMRISQAAFACINALYRVMPMAIGGSRPCCADGLSCLSDAAIRSAHISVFGRLVSTTDQCRHPQCHTA